MKKRDFIGRVRIVCLLLSPFRQGNSVVGSFRLAETAAAIKLQVINSQRYNCTCSFAISTAILQCLYTWSQNNAPHHHVLP